MSAWIQKKFWGYHPNVSATAFQEHWDGINALQLSKLICCKCLITVWEMRKQKMIKQIVFCPTWRISVRCDPFRIWDNVCRSHGHLHRHWNSDVFTDAPHLSGIYSTLNSFSRNWKSSFLQPENPRWCHNSLRNSTMLNFWHQRSGAIQRVFIVQVPPCKE